MSFPEWKKVLVVDLGFLGDTVHSIPATRALALSGAKVDVMTTPVGAELLSLVPEVNRTWVIPLRKPSPPPWKNLGTLCSIRKEKYDAAITFSGADRNLFCVAVSGASERIATVSRQRWWLPVLPLTKKIPAPSRADPLFEQRLEILRKLGWSGSNPGWFWSLRTKEKSEISSPSVYLSVSAFGSSHKEWPLHLWAETINLVLRRRPETNFIVGFADSSREKERAQQLDELARASQLHVLDSPTDLQSLALLLQKIDLFAGLDSGVLHLAMAIGKPTVSVFRDYEGREEWAPMGKQHAVLKRPCECHQQKQNFCPNEPRCLAGIPACEVAESILELLPDFPPKP